MEDRVTRAREAMTRYAWAEALEHYTAADTEGELGAADLEQFAEAAEWCYKPELLLELARRAFAGFHAAGARQDAARVALHLAHTHSHRRELAIASGWMRRAEQLLEGLPECSMHGKLQWLSSMKASGMGDRAAALTFADRAIDIATRTGDRDVLALAMLRKARILKELARAAEAMALVDEAMVAAVAGELRPMTTGVVYCATIDICNDVFDFTRAGEWTDAARRWCERTAVAGFPGVCRVHRAEILRMRGRWQEAHSEVLRANDELRAFGALNVVSDGLYELGEIRLRMGDLDGAAEAFRQSHEMGREPQPGLALLWLEQGRVQPAANQLAQALADIPREDRLRRARLLPAQVEIAIAANDLVTARAAADELDGVARDLPTPALEAYATGARGMLLVAQREPAQAIPALRRAIQLWTKLDAPYESARMRVQLAEAYRRQGDHAARELEIRAARSAFERLGAAHSLRRTEPVAANDLIAPLSATLEATPAERERPSVSGVAPTVGDVLEGKLELLRMIGGGGMGSVFEARNQRTGRLVAVKLLRRDACGDPAACQRLLQEALACGRIQHRNVVDIYDAGMHGSHPYIVMELLRGESLAQRLDREQKLPLGDAIDIALEALAGLGAAHRAGIVHRDLKPDNLFLAESAVKVVDFGISKLMEAAGRLAETQTGTVVGTPYYMSPEQAAGKKTIDERADLYAVGAVLFHAITGRPPFLGDNYNALIAAILTTPVPPLRALRPETPAPVDAAIMRALARDPGERHANTDELAAELRAAR